MKIGVIGDVHIGAGYNLSKIDPATQLHSRLLDFVNTFNSIVDSFVARQVKIVIITGDIWDTRHPTSAQLNTFSKCVKRATDKGLEILIVVGNHDQHRHISATTVDIYNALNVFGVKSYPNTSLHKIKDENNQDINLILMPYRDRRMVSAKTNSEAIETIQQELNYIIDNMTGKKIIIGHFMVEKPLDDDNPDSFSINELILPISMFDHADLTIMGHVHKHMVVSRTPFVMYSGSMDKVTFGEKDHQKVSIVIDTNDISNPEIIDSKTRNLYEIKVDYSNEPKDYKDGINKKIIEFIDAFDEKQSLKNSIVKFTARIKENDLYYIDQYMIRAHILSKHIDMLSGTHITSVASRQLRNSKITENVESKSAWKSYADTLSEPENVKKRLQKYGEQIIAGVEGK